MQASTFKVQVEYCGSCGYGKYFSTVQKAVQNKYPSAKIEGVRVPGGTGCLEVKVFPNAEGTESHLVHSKLNGEGTITDANIDTVMSKIDAIVAQK